MTSSNVNNFRVTGHLCREEFTGQRRVTWSFDVFFDLRLNKRLSKQSWGWWFETLSRHYDVTLMNLLQNCPNRNQITYMPIKDMYEESVMS